MFNQGFALFLGSWKGLFWRNTDNIISQKPKYFKSLADIFILLVLNFKIAQI